jgi:hypothetical protein
MNHGTFVSNEVVTKQERIPVDPHIVEFFALLAELGKKYTPEIYEDKRSTDYPNTAS